jgi:putative DNA primase/helicase
MTSAPNAKNIDPEQIPAELRERRQWVAWLLRVRADKLTKEPWRPTPRRTFLASSTDPSTWGTFEGAITALSWADGIGFVFAPDDPYTGVDFDECRDRLTGALDPLIASYIARLASYTEASPSGAGVHVIVRAEIPDDLDGRRRGDVKMYCRGRYFTISGDHIAGSPTTVEDRQAELEAVYHDVFPAPEPTTFTTAAPRNITGDDRELIDQAMRAANGWKFELLWNGRWDGSTSPAARPTQRSARCSRSGWRRRRPRRRAVPPERPLPRQVGSRGLPRQDARFRAQRRRRPEATRAPRLDVITTSPPATLASRPAAAHRRRARRSGR